MSRTAGEGERAHAQGHRHRRSHPSPRGGILGRDCRGRPGADERTGAAPTLTGATVIASTKNDVSAPLRSLKDKDQGKAIKTKKEREQGGIPQIAIGAPDTAVQSRTSGAAAPAAASSFEGIGAALPGISVQYAPPDTNGAIGPNHFVQTVNVSFRGLQQDRQRARTVLVAS